MTRFRHDLILRMIKLLDAVLVTIPFAMCWYLYYAKRVASPYYAKGDYLVVALFFVLFIIFGRVYDAFLMPDHAADTDALMLSIWLVTDCAMPVQAVDTESDTPDHAVWASASTPDHALEVSVFI